MVYKAPIADILSTMTGIADSDQAIPCGLSEDTAGPILAAAARFAETELVPLDRIGDREGARLVDGAVVTAPGWKDAYRLFADGGWNGISASERWGGQDLPVLLDMAVQEVWNGGAAAFATGTMLTGGAILALEAHASQALRETYLPKLVSGAWMATMNLTEAQAGSDLNALAAKAERAEDGSYRITGEKIFITYGDHDLTANIVHLVLARLPDAPDGTAGITMFLVPKFIPAADGGPGARNSVKAVGTEHKLGIHGAPTCTMVYDAAVGCLIGAEHQGLACMFTMMNVTRLSVGIQAVGVAERAFQQATAYARERRQGRAPGYAGPGMSPIADHPDVQFMLLTMKAFTAASRAICYACAQAIDMGRLAPEADRREWADRAAFLTPIAKAYASDVGIEVASLGIQVHGGAGYIEETGAAQRLRDVRIFAIYEGTNGIQAIDFASRKLVLDDGQLVRRFIDEISSVAAQARTDGAEAFGRIAECLGQAVGDLEAATAYMMAAGRERRRSDLLAGATAYLRLFATTLGASLLTKRALKRKNQGPDEKTVAIAGFFADTILGDTARLRHSVMLGGKELSAAAAALLHADNDQQ